ncbi:uncharacterized protein LOC144096922 [Amblyomma americanum]
MAPVPPSAALARPPSCSPSSTAACRPVATSSRTSARTPSRNATCKKKWLTTYCKCMGRRTSGRALYGERGVLVSAMGVHIAAAVVGALSGAMTAADWFQLKPAWSLYQISKAQFFYAR